MPNTLNVFWRVINGSVSFALQGRIQPSTYMALGFPPDPLTPAMVGSDAVFAGMIDTSVFAVDGFLFCSSLRVVVQRRC